MQFILFQFVSKYAPYMINFLYKIIGKRHAQIKVEINNNNSSSKNDYKHYYRFTCLGNTSNGNLLSNNFRRPKLLKFMHCFSPLFRLGT